MKNVRDYTAERRVVMKRFHLLLLVILLLTACGSIEPVPEDRFYRLAESAVQQRLAQPL